MERKRFVETSGPYLAPEELDVHIWQRQVAEFLKEGPPKDPTERIQYLALKSQLDNALVALRKREREAEMKIRELKASFERFNSWRISYRRMRQAENSELETYFLQPSSQAGQSALKEKLLNRLAKEKAGLIHHNETTEQKIARGLRRKAAKAAKKALAAEQAVIRESAGTAKPESCLWRM